MKALLTMTTLLLSSTFSTTRAFAHGEEKAGPNGGFIKMPAAYHTELVPEGKNNLKVYLLDMEWKNPSVKESSVELTYSDAKKTKANCTLKTNYFACTFPEEVNLLKKGTLSVASQREGQKGNEVSYDLPLKLSKTSKQDHSGHQGHH